MPVSDPLKARPIGDRAAATMTASGMWLSWVKVAWSALPPPGTTDCGVCGGEWAGEVHAAGCAGEEEHMFLIARLPMGSRAFTPRGRKGSVSCHLEKAPSCHGAF
ncbi:hypothetical protein Ssi02_34680 [Sinosporangium siamense]|uniref:Uncharacterized protein n=1 Tax=Sinosporangium siamense TaxID=1367973 RepID=A0A919RH33_9ACTN|nr:hypothetical protein Ssi02_34680 [Sinosporangium siamense]